LAFFHGGQYTQALPLFDQAVAADPNDAYARYYRGVTHGRLEQWPAAVTDLRAAAAAKPDLEQVPSSSASPWCRAASTPKRSAGCSVHRRCPGSTPTHRSSSALRSSGSGSRRRGARTSHAPRRATRR